MRLVYSVYLGFCPFEQISWEEFCNIFYNKYFSTAVVEEKRIEFISLLVKGDIC